MNDDVSGAYGTGAEGLIGFEVYSLGTGTEEATWKTRTCVSG
jgi:hypothetical protein